MMKPSLVLIVKVTRRCNLRCSYCKEWAVNSEVMQFNILANMIYKALKHKGAEEVSFIWQGGEPLIAGQDFFKKILYLQQKYKKDGQSIHNSIQTNGLLLNESWVDFLKRYGFGVGLSLDGPRELQDSQRKKTDDMSSFDVVMRNFKLLCENQITSGILTVVTPQTLELGPEAMFNFFVSEGIRKIGFLCLRPKGLPDGKYKAGCDYVTIADFSVYMQRIFDLWYNHDDPAIEIRELSDITKMLLGGKPSICSNSGDCVGSFFGININGDIYHCDRFATDRDGGHKLGNILNSGFEDIIASEKMQLLMKWNEKRVSSCKECKWFAYCRGRCPYESLYQDKKFNREDCGDASLFNHIQNRLSMELRPLISHVKNSKSSDILHA